jgi:hypothetical protein
LLSCRPSAPAATPPASWSTDGWARQCAVAHAHQRLGGGAARREHRLPLLAVAERAREHEAGAARRDAVHAEANARRHGLGGVWRVGSGDADRARARCEHVAERAHLAVVELLGLDEEQLAHDTLELGPRARHKDRAHIVRRVDVVDLRALKVPQLRRELAVHQHSNVRHAARHRRDEQVVDAIEPTRRRLVIDHARRHQPATHIDVAHVVAQRRRLRTAGDRRHKHGARHHSDDVRRVKVLPLRAELAVRVAAPSVAGAVRRQRGGVHRAARHLQHALDAAHNGRRVDRLARLVGAHLTTRVEAPTQTPGPLFVSATVWCAPHATLTNVARALVISRGTDTMRASLGGRPSWGPRR